MPTETMKAKTVLMDVPSWLEASKRVRAKRSPLTGTIKMIFEGKTWRVFRDGAHKGYVFVSADGGHECRMTAKAWKQLVEAVKAQE